MHITKMQGAGNDFIIINNLAEKLPEDELPGLARRLCPRRTAIGADGMMVIVPAVKGGDYGMLFYNSDGSVGEMCGNGARCIARYGHDHGLAGDTQQVETCAGLVTGRRITQERYRVRLNDPAVAELHRRVQACGREWDCAYFELGSPGIPHAVVRLGWSDMDTGELARLGSELRYSPAFPKGANVTFVEQSGENALSAITYERGVEEFTLACGTGCGSTVSAMTMLGLVDGKNVRVDFPGGMLEISLTCENGSVHDIFLTGPTVTVLEGETTI